MSSYVFDIEADGLYDEVTKIHCLSYKHVDGGDITTLTDYGEIADFVLGAKCLIAHNGIGYDKPTLEKILGVKIKAKFYDTLFISWYLNIDRVKHGLESFGEDFKVPKPKVDDWVGADIEVYKVRCETDVQINWLLWKDLIKRLLFLYKDKKEADRFLNYLTFKGMCAAHQAQVGWHVDLNRVERNIQELTKIIEEKTVELAKAMPPRKLYKKCERPKNCFKKDGTPSAHGQRWFEILDKHGWDRTEEGPVTVLVGTEEANPGSSDQVKDWLFSLGWEPCTHKFEKNPDGSERTIPQVRHEGELTESVKLLIDKDPAVAILDGLTVAQHRLSIFKAFKECAKDGKLKAEIAGLTNTLRMRHAKPLVNLPSVGKAWGAEVRGSLYAPEGWVTCGSDMTALENTTGDHYIFNEDPDYVREKNVPGYDPHLEMAVLSGMMTKDDMEYYKQHKSDKDHSEHFKGLNKVRQIAKAVVYSATYGIGAAKLSRTLGITKTEAQNLLDAYWKRNWAIPEVVSKLTVRKIGGQMWVQNPVSGFWHNLRFERDKWSTINQSTGVYCFDSWLAQCWVRGLKGCAQYHDEVVLVVPEGSQEETKKLLQEAIAATNDKIKLNTKLGIDVKFGRTYADVH